MQTIEDFKLEKSEWLAVLIFLPLRSLGALIMAGWMSWGIFVTFGYAWALLFVCVPISLGYFTVKVLKDAVLEYSSAKYRLNVAQSVRRLVG